MARDDIELEPTWLLHHTSHGDKNLIIELFTLGHGRVSLMARSARAARPAVRALYQPFRPLLLSWTGERELKTLIGIEEAGRALELDNRALAGAYYLNELVLRLVGKGQPQSVLFAWYGAALADLADGIDLEIVLRTFELRLLDALGVLPDLAACVRGGGEVRAAERYRFHPANAVAVPLGVRGVREAGDDGEGRAAAADSGARGVGTARGLLKPDKVDEGGADPAWHADGVTADAGVEVSGATLLAMVALDFSDANVRDEARPLMKRLLHVQLGDRPLKSRELFATLSGKGSDDA